MNVIYSSRIRQMQRRMKIHRNEDEDSHIEMTFWNETNEILKSVRHRIIVMFWSEKAQFWCKWIELQRYSLFLCTFYLLWNRPLFTSSLTGIHKVLRKNRGCQNPRHDFIRPHFRFDCQQIAFQDLWNLTLKSEPMKSRASIPDTATRIVSFGLDQ